MKSPPTDLELLQAIYERHRSEYEAAPQIAVPIDIPAIAGDLGVTAASVFGRLYHNLDPIYEVRYEDGARKALFIAQPGETKDRINFPVLEAALAGLAEQHRRDRWSVTVSLVSAGVAAGSLVVAIVALAT